MDALNKRSDWQTKDGQSYPASDRQGWRKVEQRWSNCRDAGKRML